ncbi:MAG: lipase family protein [Mariprofundaceae bacterium]
MSRSLSAVFSPQKYKPALMDCGETDCEELWQKNHVWFLSNMAHIAYFEEEKIKTFMDPLGATTFFHDIDGAQAFLAVWENRAILSFRGSQPLENAAANTERLGFFSSFRISRFHGIQLDPHSLRFLSNDVLADLSFRKTGFNGMENIKVHSGFLGEFNKIWRPISENINEHVRNMPIWVTGHSLGGALATLAGMSYAFESVITFGEPRVGFHIDMAFKAKNHIRYVNGDDPVTKVPPELLFGYDHHGEVARVRNKDGRTDFRYDHSIVYYSENLS